MAVNTEQVVLEGTGGEFLSLEEKVYRTIELLKSAREAKAAAEKVAERLALKCRAECKFPVSN